MGTFHKFGKPQSKLLAVISRIQVDILLFYGVPETFYPDIVLTPAPSVLYMKSSFSKFIVFYIILDF